MIAFTIAMVSLTIFGRLTAGIGRAPQATCHQPNPKRRSAVDEVSRDRMLRAVAASLGPAAQRTAMLAADVGGAPVR